MGVSVLRQSRFSYLADRGFSGKLASGQDKEAARIRFLQKGTPLALQDFYCRARQNVPVPANIGLGAVHNPIHTHDDPGVIHMEFDGAVRQDNTRLQKFFEAWNKQLSATCLLDECGGTVTMRVNGVPNTELSDYIMKDKDTIEISYEQKM